MSFSRFVAATCCVKEQISINQLMSTQGGWMEFFAFCSEEKSPILSKGRAWVRLQGQYGGGL